MKPKVNVLISTYNGEKYLKEQLDSILIQTYQNIDIYVRDDGSKDGTISILKEYEKAGKIHFLQGKNVGFIDSFFTLLKDCDEAEYYAFCDQDDVWLEDKIKRAVTMLEENKEESLPILYYSNYDFYDTNMTFQSHAINKKKPSFLNCLVECINLGMTTVINENARNIAIKNLPSFCEGHDWWLYMICEGMGKVLYDETVTAKHRLHESNTSECGKNFISLQIHRIKSLFQENYFKTIHKQIQEYATYFLEDLSKENQEILKLFNIEKFRYRNQLKKLCYPKRYRQVWTDEIMIRFMFLIGAI